MTAYQLWVCIAGTRCYAGTAWTLQAALAVLDTYAARGYPGHYDTTERR